MTVLEKIKRCVSLVWDFQEIYGEEDIEDFCHNELSTYPQHDEIMGYFKHIEELEKENSELKEKLEHRNCVDCSNHGSNIKLLKAKAIIKALIEALSIIDGEQTKELRVVKEAEQFLKEERK